MHAKSTLTSSPEASVSDQSVHNVGVLHEDRLFTCRILTRLECRIGGVRHGPSSFIWLLDVVGDRLTRGERSSRRRVREPSFAFLQHTLAVTEIHIQIWEAANTGGFRLTNVEVETEAWRDYVATGGVKTVLKPDLRITIGSDAFDDHWYVEVDRGTESLPVLLRKSSAYEEYRRTGRAQAELGVFPCVLWLMPDTARAERDRRRAEAAGSTVHLRRGGGSDHHTDQPAIVPQESATNR